MDTTEKAALGYPPGPLHRPRGRFGHVVALATSRTALPAAQVALERSAPARLRRLTSTAADRLRERRHPSRQRMRALVAAPGGRLEWRDVPAPPSPSPDAAVVHPVAVATCDLDRAMALGRAPFPLPMQFGHECVAEVVQVGDAVTLIQPGDQVVVPFQISCGRCAPCRAGLTSNCASVPPISMYGFGLFGGQWGGALADLLAVPFADAMLVPLPAGISPEAAASVADNVADGYRCIAPYLPQLLARDPDAEVLILAELGRRPPLSASVPMYVGLVAQALGARHVHLVDRRPHVRRHGESMGFEVHRDLRGVRAAALVVDGTVCSRGPLEAIRRTAPDGVCVSVGSLSRTSKIPTTLMYGRNVRYELSRSHVRANIPGVLELMRTGALRPEAVITDMGPLDRADSVIHQHVVGESTKTIVAE